MFYTKILDEDGNVVIDNTPEERKVIKPSTAYLLTSAMEDVVSEGTGTRLQLSNMHVAGKTVQPIPTMMYGLQDSHHITPVQSGLDMTITPRSRIPEITEPIIRTYGIVL